MKIRPCKDLQPLNEETLKDLDLTTWPQIRARVKSQNLRSEYLGCDNNGRLYFRTTSGTTPGKWWQQQIEFENIPEAVRILNQNLSARRRSVLKSILEGNVKLWCQDYSWHYYFKGVAWKNGYGLQKETRPNLRNNVQEDHSLCFTAGTKVLTSKGFVSIENIRPGDRVFTHRGRLRTVTGVMNRQAEVEDYQVGGDLLSCTKDHPFLSVKCSYTSLDWRPIGQMHKKWWILSPRIESGYLHLDERLAFILGLYLGDGTIGFEKVKNPDKSIYPCIDGKIATQFNIAINKRYVDIYRERIEGRYGFKINGIYNDKSNDEGQGAHIQIRDHELIRFLLDYGGVNHGDLTKRLDERILNLDDISAKMLLMGFFWADGTIVQKSDGYCYATFYNTNENIIQMLNILMRRFYPSALYEYRYKRTRIYKDRELEYKTMYSFCLTGQFVKDFIDWDPVVSEIKGDKNRGRSFSKYYPKQIYNGWVVGFYKKLGNNRIETVYNISVEEDESYLVTRNMLSAHNCKHLVSCFYTLPSVSEQILKDYKKKKILPNMIQRLKNKIKSE